MTYRYCPECEKWLATNEYTFDASGETVCPGHKAVHGYIPEHLRGQYTERDFRRDNAKTMYKNWETMLKRAKEQGLVQ